LIGKQEILDLVTRQGLRPGVIEKDYALGWILAGINAHPILSKSFVFKGGTCLKKCYFETYRFSEDLDFTVIDPELIKEDRLTEIFGEVSDWVMEESGLELPFASFDTYENKRGGTSSQGKLEYRGPVSSRGSLPRIKLDLTLDEILVDPPAIRNVIHEYSDLPSNGIQIPCYSFEEVFAEKIRALSERLRPRDLYDVVHLYWRDPEGVNKGRVTQVLKDKCQFKNIPLPTIKSLIEHPLRADLDNDWEPMLGHQLRALPDLGQFWATLPDVFQWLYGEIKARILEPIKTNDEIDMTWEPTAPIPRSIRSPHLGAIQFAAANRLCIDLRYNGSQRLIRPYSIRKSKAGHFLLMAVKHISMKPRSYRIDRIQDVKISDQIFKPDYEIEIAKGGTFDVLPTKRKSRSSTASYMPKNSSKRKRNSRKR